MKTRILFVAIGAILLIGHTAHAEKRAWNPPELFQSEDFSHVVLSDGAKKIVFIAAQSAAEGNAPLEPGVNLQMQTRRALANLGKALEAAGAKPEDVVSMHIYVKDHQYAKALIVARQTRRFFSDHVPASSFIPVQSLPDPNSSIEIDAIAEIDRP